MVVVLMVGPSPNDPEFVSVSQIGSEQFTEPRLSH